MWRIVVQLRTNSQFSGQLSVKYSIKVVLLIIATMAAAQAADTADDPYRLNPAVKPQNQHLEMTLDPRELRYSGTTRIALDVMEKVDFILLHAQDMTIINADFGTSGALERADFEQLEHALLKISTGSTIAAGQYELKITFEDDFNTDSVSMYRVEENGRFHIFSQMEASEAREAFPCFDEPAYKIPWTLTLTVPANMMAVSNTPIERTRSAGEMKELVFAESAPMSSYLIAIAVGQFETVDIPGMSVPGRVVTTLGKKGLTELAVESTPKLLAGLESYFDTRYPYQKLDLIATPEFWYGAMENPGAIIYLDTALLIDPGNVDATRFRSIVGTNSHELAHQWFGDVVTMDWWVDLWLNESFASWMGDKIVEQVYPELDIAKSRMSTMFKTMDRDAQPASRPIRAPRLSTDNFLNDIGPAYSKGRIVINMFEKAVGEDQFRTGILEYMKRHQWGNATAVDFSKAIGIEADFDVPKAFASFMNQPGIPLVDAELLDDGRLALSQRRFVQAHDELAELQWTIPLTIRYGVDGKEYRQSLLLDDVKQVVELDHPGDVEWIYPNADQGGYYRWRMPPHQLQAVVDNAQEMLGPMERMGLVSNLTALLKADTIAADDYLAALASFSTERDPYVLDLIIDQLEVVRDALVSDDHQVDFAGMVKELLEPALQSIGTDVADNESNAVTTIRPRLLAWLIRDARDEILIDEFSTLADEFLARNTTLHSSLVPPALVAAAISGTAETYEQFKQRFENARTPTERGQMLFGLTQFESEEILLDLQHYSLSNAVRPREIMSFREQLVKRPGPRDLVLDYALNNFESFRARLPGNGLAIVPAVAKSCSLANAETATDFFSNPDHQVSGTLRILDTTTAAIKSCAALRQRELENASRYFSSL
jgi:alanyl aminopeptidase